MTFLNPLNYFRTHPINEERVDRARSTLISDTITALAVSALALTGAGYFQNSSPEFSGVLLAVPVISVAIWLIRRIGSRTIPHYNQGQTVVHLNVDQTPHLQPQPNYWRWNYWNPIRFVRPYFQGNHLRPLNTDRSNGDGNIQHGRTMHNLPINRNGINVQHGSNIQQGQTKSTNGMHTLPINRNGINIQ